MKRTVTSKILTGLLAILMVFAMIPVTTEAVFADNEDVPLLTIVMVPGDGTGEQITVTSKDAGRFTTNWPPDNGLFCLDHFDPTVIVYRCIGKPDGFTGPSDESFRGWVIEGLSSEPLEAGKFVMGHDGDKITLIAAWSHTVSFDSRSDSNIPPQFVHNGEKAAKPEEPLERDGWKFEYWYAGSEINTPYNFDDAVTGNLQLTALWAKSMMAHVLDISDSEPVSEAGAGGTFDVKTSASNFDLKNQTTMENHLPEGPVTFTAKPKEGYHFVGWYKGWHEGYETLLPDTLLTENTEFTTTVGGNIDALTAVFSHHSSATRNENEVGPTCTQPGGYDVVEYCTICGNELNRTHVETPAKGHEFADDFTVDLAPTCTEKGSKSKHCTHENCDAKTDVTEIPATDHIWDSVYTVDKAATRTAAGSKSIHCKVCKAVKPGSVQTIAKLPPKEIRNLAAVKISKPSAGKKKVTVKWKKVSKKNQKKIQGIEIQVATDSKFKSIVKSTTASKKKVSKTVKGLKSKRTYWVRIRAYKNASDGKHVSAWKVKKVKVK